MVKVHALSCRVAFEYVPFTAKLIWPWDDGTLNFASAPKKVLVCANAFEQVRAKRRTKAATAAVFVLELR